MNNAVNHDRTRGADLVRNRRFGGQAESHRLQTAQLWSGGGRFVSGEPLDDLLCDLFESAVQLHAGVAEAGVIEPMLVEELPDGVVVGFFAAMFQEQGATNQRVTEVAGHGR